MVGSSSRPPPSPHCKVVPARELFPLGSPFPEEIVIPGILADAVVQAEGANDDGGERRGSVAIAARAASELPAGGVVNLGNGCPP